MTLGTRSGGTRAAVEKFVSTTLFCMLGEAEHLILDVLMHGCTVSAPPCGVSGSAARPEHKRSDPECSVVPVVLRESNTNLGMFVSIAAL